MRIGLIIIGDEILSGKRQDKHFAKILGLLDARGLELSSVTYLGDERDRLSAALRASRLRKPLSRAARTKLVAKRLTSHSQGAGSVSSRSLM